MDGLNQPTFKKIRDFALFAFVCLTQGQSVNKWSHLKLEKNVLEIICIAHLPGCGNFRIFLSLRFYMFQTCPFCNFSGSEFCWFGIFRPFDSAKLHKSQNYILVRTSNSVNPLFWAHASLTSDRFSLAKKESFSSWTCISTHLYVYVVCKVVVGWL